MIGLLRGAARGLTNLFGAAALTTQMASAGLAQEMPKLAQSYQGPVAQVNLDLTPREAAPAAPDQPA